jgi:hypothetical protein
VRAFREFCVLLAFYLALKLTMKNTKATEFHGAFRAAMRLRSGERGLLAHSARQLAEHNFPSASCRRVQAGCLRSPENQKGTAREKQRLFPITLRIIVDDAILVTCVCFALRKLRAGGHASCRFPGAA